MRSDWLHLLPVSAFALLWWLGRWRPARSHAPPPRAAARCAAIVSFAGLGVAVPWLIPADGLARHAWIDGRPWGLVGGVLIGWPAWTLVQYGFHRACHQLPWLWRLHRFHHSARWIDVSVGLWFHPLEVVLVVTLNQLLTRYVLGLTPEAASVVGQLSVLSLLLIHSNIRTPACIGWLVYRPEAHLLHHQRGVHGGNFCDLPLWDLVFGTHRPPSGVYAGPLGFDDPLSAAELLLGREHPRRRRRPTGALR